MLAFKNLGKAKIINSIMIKKHNPSPKHAKIVNPTLEMLKMFMWQNANKQQEK